MASLRFEALHQGPPKSAHGGTTVARLGAQVPGGLSGGVSVRLRLPPPLDRDLPVVEEDGTYVLRDGLGGEVVATAHAAPLELDVPDPPPPEAARAAAAASWMNDPQTHPFARCFGCGPLAPPEALHLRPGAVDDVRHACVWTPPADVDAALVLAALDCPSCAPVERIEDLPGPFVLGTMHGRVDGLPVPGVEHVVTAWLLGRDGRKVRLGAALHAPDGAVLARAEALWISLRAAGS